MTSRPLLPAGAPVAGLAACSSGKRLRRWVAGAALLGLFAPGVAACSGGKGSPTPSASAAGANAQLLLDAGKRLAQCARDHGYPKFPDPHVDNGRLVYSGADAPSKEQLRAITEIPECRVIADQLPQQPNQLPSVTAADLQKLREFAKCMREHGIAEWPDPKADGTFPIIGTPIEAEGKSERWIAATGACQQYWDKNVLTS